MPEQARGVTVALILVTLAALVVAFGSSSKAKGATKSLTAVRAEVQKLTQEKKALQESLQETQEQYAQEAVATKSLKEALVQEQLKSQSLAEELQRLKRETPTSDVQSPSGKKTR